jgi:hypothetical protein
MKAERYSSQNRGAASRTKLNRKYGQELKESLTRISQGLDKIQNNRKKPLPFSFNLNY